MTKELSMKKYVVEEKPLQAVLDYLATRPFKEVTTLIVNIQSGNKPFDENLKFTEQQMADHYKEAYEIGLKNGKDSVKALETFSDD